MKKVISMIVIACACLLCACTNSNSQVSQVVDSQINSAVQETKTNGDKNDNSNYSSANDVKNVNAADKYTDGTDGAVDKDIQESSEDSSSDDNASGSNENVDVDLTLMSSTMVYSEVYNMMMNPDDYMGKTIKIIGPYYSFYLNETGKYYHAVIISDATACCSNGLEFVWDDNTHVYPDEYPENNTIIELVGTFGSYEELGQTYYYLATNSLSYK